jgi:hypothetical protein
MPRTEVERVASSPRDDNRHVQMTFANVLQVAMSWFPRDRPRSLGACLLLAVRGASVAYMLIIDLCQKRIRPKP